MDITDGQYTLTDLQTTCRRANYSNLMVHLLFKKLKRIYNGYLNFIRSSDVNARLGTNSTEDQKRELELFKLGVTHLKKELDEYIEAYNILQEYHEEDDKRYIRANTRVFCSAPRGVLRTFIREANRVYQRTIDKLEALNGEQELTEP